MVKLETYRRKRRSPDIQKCAVVAALLSAVLVSALELSGSPVGRANAGLGKPAVERSVDRGAEPGVTVTAPASTEH